MWDALLGNCAMSNVESKSESEESNGSVMTVVRSVLSEFFDELTKVEGLVEIAPNLRKVVLDDGVFAEPAIRAALFPDSDAP
jgi:hypothetical protein